jgi:hypothetical protein
LKTHTGKSMMVNTVKSLDQISVQPWQFGDKAQKKALVYG